ncbi:hypothetical protein LMG28614_07281 [Paraburkholderia ultramafica]|uniref:Uncharacterized protein n=1 Tax=Paraburkholderia ultramafica TaxID=1544867 RepID=A0A6S7BS64_9BURK|nr:hypothetical protein LMG28614_07281 [Paraburkholderia ultramafica]
MLSSMSGGRAAFIVRPAAQCIRMSTEYQHYSPENQKRSIAEFAAAHKISIVGPTKTPERVASAGIVSAMTISSNKSAFP